MSFHNGYNENQQNVNFPNIVPIYLLVCLFVCLFVCLVRYDCHSALHCTVHWIYCTAKLWFGSSLAQGTRNSTDAVRRCTVTDRLAWVKTRSWLILHCLVDLKVNLTLRHKLHSERSNHSVGISPSCQCQVWQCEWKWQEDRVVHLPVSQVSVLSSHPLQWLRVHSQFCLWALPTSPTQRQNCECTRSHCNGWLLSTAHLTDRQVDYPVFLSLPLTLSDLALATGEIPTEWFDRSLCNLWTDLRSALLYSALQLWKSQENFQKYSTEPLRVTAVWLECTKVAGLKQFHRGYFSHSYVNATGAVNFEVTDLETESSQTFQTAYTTGGLCWLTLQGTEWHSLLQFSSSFSLWALATDSVPNGKGWTCQHSSWTEEVHLGLQLWLWNCGLANHWDWHWSQGWHPDQRTWAVIHWHRDHCEEGQLRWHWDTLNSDC